MTLVFRASLALAIGGLIAGQAISGEIHRPDEAVRPLLERYCLKCHGPSKPKGDFVLSKLLEAKDPGEVLESWEKVLEVIQAREMPPAKQPQPNEDERKTLSTWIEGQFSTAGCKAKADPGRVTLRRLNRAEYNNTIRDLLGIEYRPADDFPSDDVGYGFDNIADVLSLPPPLMEKYLGAAEAVADRTVVADSRLDPPIRHVEAETLNDASGNVSDNVRVLATNGDVMIRYNFQKEGRYLLRVRASAEQAGDEPAKMEARLDGMTLGTFDVPQLPESEAIFEQKFHAEKGRKPVGISFVNDKWIPDAPDPSRRDRNLHVDWIEIQGPFLGDKNLPSPHARLFSPRPDKGDQAEDARAILSRLATRAYRRPATPAEVDRLVRLVEQVTKDGERFERGIQLAVQAVLVSPNFLFRVEESGAKGANPSLDYALASRLSYFLWSSMPDDALFELASQGKLSNPDVLEAQARRMLADPKAKALVENFFLQWLQLRNLKLVNPDPKRFPGFDDSLRAAMLEETEQFASAILKEDRSLLEFLDSDYTYLNEKLAKHYGIDGVRGDHFRRVALPSGGVRGGLLAQASILTVTSNPTRTSPVKRGKWILEQILGSPPPPPPPDVPELSDGNGKALTGSLRTRMEQHRADANCATCHQRMDPLGFGFENFDAVGAWRDKDEGFAIDPSGTLPSGQSFQGPSELKTILKSRQREFLRCLSEKMFTYALGRGVAPYDRCVLDQIVDHVASDGNRAARLVAEIVRSDSFRFKTSSTPTEGARR